MPAKIIALEGIDQSGKRTQTRLLSQRLRRKGFKVSQISFPIYGTSTGKAIRAFLKGKRDYPPQALHMLYSLNRWENLESIRKLATHSDFVIVDRYIPSNLAYGMSRGLGLEWLISLDKGLPEANLVLILDLPVLASFARKSRDRDVHERDSKFLLRVRRVYRLLAGKLGWKVVNAAALPQIVHTDVWNQVRKNFRKTLKGMS